MHEIQSVTWALADFGAKDDKKPTADGSFLRASSVSSCIRKQIYDGLELPFSTANLQNSTNGLVAREIGNTLHEQIQRALQANPIVFKDFVAEVPVSLPEFMRSGHADGVYTNDSNHRVVVEIKTMRNYGFRKARREGPKEEHLLQAAAYAMGLGYNLIHMVYVCTDATPGKWKDSARAGDMIEWLVDLDDIIDQSGATLRVIATYVMSDECAQAGMALDNDLIPDGLKAFWDSVDDMPWECKYCGHYSLCEISMGDSVSEILKCKGEYFETTI